MITFRNEIGLYWPDYDQGAIQCHGYVLNRLSDVDVGVSYCRKHFVAVQAGGHVGLWPLRLADTFKTVITFEPDQAAYLALARNTSFVNSIKAYPLALGDVHRDAKMLPATTTGGWKVRDEGTIPVTQTTIDLLCLKRCDLITLDIEGREVEALRGARETIQKHRPVLHLEYQLKFRDAIDAEVKLLKYRMVKRVHNDAIFVKA